MPEGMRRASAQATSGITARAIATAASGAHFAGELDRAERNAGEYQNEHESICQGG